MFKRNQIVEFSTSSNTHLKEMTPDDLGKKLSKKHLLSSSVILPSQYHAYSLCVEFVRDWFLNKFNSNYFTSTFIDGKLSLDEFKRFSKLEDKLTRVNPVLAITPTIDSEYTRDNIDLNLEGPYQSLRRTQMEGKFFSDFDRKMHIAVQFKSIKMTFNFKMRVNTRAEQLDLLEFVKTNCKAGLSETNNIILDIHVPKQIIAQVAHDIGLFVDEKMEVKEPYKLLQYLNSHSVLPFLYKFRCATGNNEFFIKVPNCTIYMKMEMPTKDDGERVGVDNTNYTVEFSLESEMTAPMSYIYYSMDRQDYLSNKEICSDGIITIDRLVATDIPDKNPDCWDLFVTTEYLIEEEDLNKPLTINLKDFIEGTDLNRILQYNIENRINPSVFLDFKFFIDGIERKYHMDWSTLSCDIEGVATNLTTVIAVYIDKNYVNETLINLDNMYDGRVK